MKKKTARESCSVLSGFNFRLRITTVSRSALDKALFEPETVIKAVCCVRSKNNLSRKINKNSGKC